MISVVIPSNNCNSWLEEAIDSVLNSKCNVAIEIFLILNNLSYGEDFKLQQIENKYGDKLRTVNLGSVSLVDALNFGVNNSKYDFIARLDSDDTMSEFRLQKQYDFLVENKRVAAVGSAVNLIDEKSQIVGKRRYPLTNPEIKACFRFGNCLAHPTMMFRRDVFNFTGGYSNDYRFAEDFDFFVRISRNFQIANSPEFLTNYRVFDGQITAQFIGIQETNSLAIIKREFNYYSYKPKYKLILESKILKSRFARTRDLKFGGEKLVFWTVIGLLLNFKATFQYVRQALLNSRFGSIHLTNVTW
jgi:glycosyltransferase involved in cell wall biosynthesis